ncbi:MAG: thioredoxin family protein [Bacteroidota bacterium]
MIKLQVLGVDGHPSTQSLMQNTLDAVKRLKIAVIVEKINDIDYFLTYDLKGVPALAVDGQLAFQQVVPEVEELMQTVNRLIPPKL